MAKKTVEKNHSTTDQDVDDPIKNGGDSYTAERLLNTGFFDRA